MFRNHQKLNCTELLSDDKNQYYQQRKNFESSHKYFLSGLTFEGQKQIILKPGEKLLKRFTIESYLGQGRFATVYLANDDIRATNVALKVIALASEDIADRAIREIILNSEVLDYNNVIHIYDMHPVTYKGRVLLLISMEYAEGGSLRDWLEENRNNISKRHSEGIELFLQLCYGVKSLHDVGIIHKDIKPENLLRVKGVFKVSDLGLSRNLYGTQMSSVVQDRPNVIVCGTPVYMSPEQFVAAHPDDIDFRSDIYSLGIILFEIYHPRCRPPFAGSYEQLQDRHLNMKVYLPDGLDANIRRIISKCLQKDPANRYQSVTDLMNDILGRSDHENHQHQEDMAAQEISEKVEQLWQNACQAVEEGDLVQAARYCRKILDASPEHEDARCMLDDIQSRYERAQRSYQTIERNINFQSLESLSTLLAQATEIYPDHPYGELVQTQLVTIAQQYESAMCQGIFALTQGRFSGAVVSFERARQLNPGLPIIDEIIDFTKYVKNQVERTRAIIDNSMEQGNQQKAMFLAIQLDEYIEHISQMANNCRNVV